MALQNYTKTAPNSLKQKIKVPDFTDNEQSKQAWIEKEKQKKFQDLQNWVGCSYADNPMMFIEELISILGLPGFKLAPRKKWQGADGILLHLRAYKAKYHLREKYQNAFIADEKAIRMIKDTYPEYRGISTESLLARYHDKENKNSHSIREVIEYLKSEKTTEKDKIFFIERLEKALEHIAKI